MLLLFADVNNSLVKRSESFLVAQSEGLLRRGYEHAHLVHHHVIFIFVQAAEGLHGAERRLGGAAGNEGCHRGLGL